MTGENTMGELIKFPVKEIDSFKDRTDRIKENIKQINKLLGEAREVQSQSDIELDKRD